MPVVLNSSVRPDTASTPPTLSVGVLSTFPPTVCGLATFSAPLVTHLLRVGVDARVVRVLDTAEPSPPGPIVAQLVNDDPRSMATAVATLNDCDAVLIQHEYGIYGGPDGEDVLAVVSAVSRPMTVVLHTVLATPTARQRAILSALIDAADVIVTMTHAARRLLASAYGVTGDRVHVIPHGALDHGGSRQPRSHTTNRPLILTWGLLGPGKGIEWAIEAMTTLRDLRPRYLVVGTTHPKVLQREGEAYRDRLLAAAHAGGVADLVEIDGSYLSNSELAALVERADVVVLPYDSREQVTSGVLIEAVAAGRPVVSTGFPHAVELLGDGSGLVVPQRDAPALAAALRRILTEPALADEMSRRATRKAPQLHWAGVAERYRAIVARLAASPHVAVL